MTQLHSHDLARPGATIRYWSGGPDNAATVVFLHGATLDHRAWHPQTDALRRRFRVVAPDLRGHGSSTGRFDSPPLSRTCSPSWITFPARRSCWSGSASAPTSPRRSSAADPTSSVGKGLLEEQLGEPVCRFRACGP